MIVYAAENLVNGKLYVGITTTSLVTRWAAHVRLALGGGKTALSRAIRKHGADAFAIEEIAHLLPGLDVDDLRLLEREIIAQENTMVPHGYNLTSGGEGLFGRQLSDELRQRFSEVFTGRANPHKGESLSAEHCAKLSAAWSPERRKAQAERMHELTAGKPSPKRGVALTEDHKAALRAGHASRKAKGLKRAVTTRAPRSEAAKAKTSASLYAFNAAKRAQNEVLH